MQTLTERLLSQQEESKKRIPLEYQELMDKAISDIEASGTAPGLKVGDRAPDFELPNAKGERVRLSEELKKGPVVISFYRGGWCPYCNLELRAYQQIIDQILSLGAQLIAISPQTPDASLNTQEKNELTFQVLSDVGNKVASDYKLTYRLPDYLIDLYKKIGINLPGNNNDDSWTLPVSGTLVIDSSGIVRLAHSEKDYKKRLDPINVLTVLQELTK